MKQRRNLDREGLEVYLGNLLLAYRSIFQICGLICFVYSIAALSFSVAVGILALVVAFMLGLLSYSYPVTRYTAKVGAWLGTIRKK